MFPFWYADHWLFCFIGCCPCRDRWSECNCSSRRTTAICDDY